MASPKFNLQDKIIYDNPYFVPQRLSPRRQTDAPPTVYVVVAFSPQTGTYYVQIPGNKDAAGTRMFLQFDLENSFRLADQWEVSTYF